MAEKKFDLRKCLLIASIVSFVIAFIIFIVPMNGYSLYSYWFSGASSLASAFGVESLIPGLAAKKAFFFIFLIAGVGCLIGKSFVKKD